MSNYAGFTVLGASGQNERTASSVTNIGDINGDGLADFAVTAPGAEAPYSTYYGEGVYNRYNGGAVYVVFGDEDTDGDGPDTGLPTSINVDDLDGTNGFRINPDGDLFDQNAFYDAGFGVNVTALGDVNGDGVDDFGIAQSATNYVSYYGGGFYGEYGPQTPDGVAYVILGGQNFEAEQEVDDLAGFRIDTESHVEEIVALGDVNGDGFADVGLNTVNRQTDYTYIDYTYLSDYNGNGVYDAYDPDTFPYFEFYYSGSARVSTGVSTSYVIFGTDQARISDDPIAQSGGGGGPILATFALAVVPDDAPTAGEIIVDATQLDGGDGFSVETGTTLTQVYNFNEFGYGYFGSTYETGGIAGAGDINGDGVNDIIATESGYYQPLLNSGETLSIVRDANTGNVTFTPSNYTTSSSTSGNFVIFGNAEDDPFQEEITLNTLDPDVDLQAFFDFDGSVQGIGDVSGDDGRDELAFGQFLSTTRVARDADGNFIRDADGNIVFEDNPDNPFDVSAAGIAVINGTSGDFLSDGTATNREFDLGDLINGQGAFFTDTSSQVIRDFNTGEVSFQGVFIENGPGQIAAIGDINNDGIADFAFVGRRTDQVEEEIILIDDEVQTSNETVQRNVSQDAVYLVFGQADPLTGVIDLAETFNSDTAAEDRLAFRIEGLESSFFFTEFDRNFPTESRVNVSGGFDIDGDDISDVVIGSPGANGQSFDDGAAFVVFGGLDALAAADAADGLSDGVIDTANLGVNVETGVLPITVTLRDAGFFSRFQSEGDIGATPFTFEVTRSGDLSEEVSFDFAVTPSGFDPTEAEDFVGGAFPTGTVTFADGADTALVTVNVQGDFVQEGTEDFTVTISNATTDGPSPISITGDTTFARIFNDDQPVRFFAGNGSVIEGDVDADNRELVLTVFRSGETQVEASVDFQIQLTTAELDDFESGVLPLSGTLTFDVGETSQQIVLPIAEDIEIEGNEQVRLLLDNATSEAPAGSPPGTVIPAIISDSVGIGTILTDDFAVEFRVSNAFVTEGDVAADNRELVFTVTRSGDLDPAARVDLSFVTSSFNAADASDFEVNPFGTQTLNFASGQTTQTIRLAIDEDVDIEANERIDARLSNQQLADGSTNDVLILDGFGSGTINNDDFPPRISVNGGGFVFEGTGSFASTTVTFEITRTGETAGVTDVTFDLNPLPFPGDFFAADSQDISGIAIDGVAVSGSGFLPLFGQTVRFEDGESVKTVTVDIVRDGIIEPREQFELRITEVDALNGVDYDIFTPARTATILNDDGRPPVIPPGVEADVFGDPHIVTLDGLGYDFQATGEYILVETLEGAANPFQVQVRFEPLPGSDLVSTTTRMAVQIGDATLEIDALGANPLLITDANGNTRTPTVEERALGAADINGDTINDVFFNEDLSEFFIALNDLGQNANGETQSEQLMVKNMDGTLNVCVFLSDLPGGNQGNVRGLMGDADGTGDTTDDIALREGTVVPVGAGLVDINGDPIPEGIPLTEDTPLPQPIDFSTLYGIYAESWNLDGTNGKDSFFTGDPVPRDPDFPAALLTIDDLPDDVRAAAEAAVLAAQDPNDPLDSAIFEAAVLDFALTGNPDFISGALGLAAEQTAETEPENAPDLPVTVSVSADPTGLTEGDAGSQNVVFTFSRLDDALVPLSIAYAITGTADASDVAEGTDFTGTIDFSGEEMTQTVTIEVLGDLLTEDDETLIVTITDAGDALIAGATAEVIIATDDFAPEAQDDAFSTDEDTRVSGDVFSDNQIEDPADNSDTDADGDDLSIVNVTLSNGAVRAANGALIILPSGAHLRINEDGTFDYDPFGFSIGLGNQNDSIFDQLGAGEVAVETFSYLVSDGNGGEDTATVTITVQGIDDAPVAVIDEFIVDENGSVSGNVIDGTISPDFDPEGGDLTVTRINGVLLADADEDADSDGAQITIGDGGILTVFANGDVSFDTNGAYERLGDLPGQLVSRLQSVQYTIEDEGGLTDTAALRFSVRGDNDGPMAVDDTASGDEDTSIFIDVLANDTDVDSDAEDLRIIAPVGDLEPSNGSVEQDVETGELIYTPDDDFFGTDTFSYVISDGELTSEATVTVTVNSVNDRPEANDDRFVTDEDTAINDNLILGDTGIGLATPDFDVDGDQLQIVEVRDSEGTVLQLTNGNVLPEGGQVAIGADGAFFYDPTFNGGLDRLGADETELVTLTYVVSDGELTDEATIEILVTGVNDDPMAVDDGGEAFTTDEDTAFTTGDVLANDQDVDSEALSVSGLNTAGTLGLVTSNGDGTFDYDPNGAFENLAAGEVGEDRFEYTVSDGDGGVDTAIVTITVIGVDDGVGPNLIEGTEGNDNLVGTAGDDLFTNLGSGLDFLTGNGGSDTFEFGDELNNGVRETTYLLDFDADDFLNLNGSGFTEVNVFGITYLIFDGDSDVALLFTADFDETSQLI